MAPLCNVGVGGILARHNRVMSTPATGRQGRLIPFASPAGRPGALAGCALRQGPARCTSHGPVLIAGQRLTETANRRLHRSAPVGRKRPRLRLRGCCAAPVGHCSARVALRASLHRSPGRGYDKLHRRPGARLGPPIRATQDTPRCAPGFLAALRLTFPPMARSRPRRSGNSILHENMPIPLINGHNSVEITLKRIVCYILFSWSQ